MRRREKMKKNLSVLFGLVLISSMVLAACGGGSTATQPPAATEPPAAATQPPAATEAPATEAATQAAATGELYYLNFKPEVADVYTKIGDAWKAETGNTLKVVTAASGTYEQTLKSEIAKSDPPVLFQINGPVGYAAWKDYTADLSGIELYKHLSDKNLAVTDGNGVYGLPYVIEGYGIIYNNAIMDKYFALPDAKAKSMAEVNNFAMLKAVADDMQAKKDQLGIGGVFCSTSLKPGEDWRWQTHLADVPIFYEFRDNKVDIKDPAATMEVKFQYADNFKNIFDLYLNDSDTAKTLLGSKSVDDSMSEFALGQCVMVQNGNWAWGQISGVDGNTVKAEDVKFLPIYSGMPGEEKQSINVGTENFFAINKQASPDKQKLAADFIWWLYSSPTGKKFVTNDLKFIAPFDTFADNEKPTDPLAKEVLRYVSNPDLYNVAWNFTVFPGQPFKDAFGAALLQYAQGSMQWPDVKQLFIDQWKAEKAKTAGG
jgi:raffinose/stachyose/melibiose transport system substrate-binding protein